MLQQRALHKYHSPGLWTNTCCSHQREGENSIEAGKRRLLEEMGFETELKIITSFIYKVEFENVVITGNTSAHYAGIRSMDAKFSLMNSSIVM